MAEKDKKIYKNFKCPNCGSPIVAEDNGKPIECVYCCSKVVPESNVSAAPVAENNLSSISGTLRVEGIKTPSSALAYIEQYFEDYDWGSFVYSQGLSIAEADKLVDSLKTTSADDKNTWFVAFAAVFMPYIKKIEYCDNIVSDIIEKYKKDDLDAYSKFDAYKRITAMLNNSKASVVEKLQKIIDKASKYGATAKEIADLKNGLENIKSASDLKVYASVEEIPGIKAYNDAKNNEIAKKLSAKGINADAEYQKAKSLIDANRFVEALNVLVSLEGYLDSEKLADKVDKYFLMGDVLEITGRLYFYKHSVGDESASYSLYPTDKGKVLGKPVVKFIKKIITNYADVLYYIDTQDFIRRYSFATDRNEKLYKASVSGAKFFVYNRKAYFKTSGETVGKLIELDLATGAVQVVLESVSELMSITDSKLVFFGRPVIHNPVSPLPKDQITKVKRTVNVIDLETKAITVIGEKKLTVEAIYDNYVIYTKKAPSKKNLNLFVKELGKFDSEKLIEKNILQFREIFDKKLIYDIGNDINKTLVYANIDGSDRKEWPLNIAALLFEQGGWVYFLRKSGRNSILCKSHIGDKKFSVIAKDVEDFEDIRNGYLYYTNFYSELIKVRMDGTNSQKICDDVHEVIAIKEDKVVFSSVDGLLSASETIAGENRSIVSIYEVDFTGSGKRKLVYQVKNVKEFDENKVYYTAMRKNKIDEIDSDNSKIEKLYSLDINTGTTKELLTLENNFVIEKSPLTKVFTVISVILLFVSMIAFISEAVEAGMAFLVFASISAIVALLFKVNQGKNLIDHIKEKLNDAKQGL